MNYVKFKEIGLDELEYINKNDCLIIEFHENPKGLDYKLLDSDCVVGIFNDKLWVFDLEYNLMLRVQTKYIKSLVKLG